MSKHTYSSLSDPTSWNLITSEELEGDLLQSWEWGQFKEKFGWIASRYMWSGLQGRPGAAAQILERSLRIPGTRQSARILYCPRGPTLNWADEKLRTQVLQDLIQLVQEREAIFLKIDPLVPISMCEDSSDITSSIGKNVTQTLRLLDWRPSNEQVQFKNTLHLDLEPSEDELLASMKQKTRYNVRLAARSGVNVREGGLEDLDLLYRLYAETSVRDGFVIRQLDYYVSAWGDFIESGMAQPLIAEFEGEAIAALILYQFGKSAKYMYGMSRSEHREKMPNYLLQWEAIRWAKVHGCHTYDFWGAPDSLDEKDPLWGLYRFKSGFGAVFVESIGAWDHVFQHRSYQVYTQVLPRILNLMRVRGQRQTRRLVD